MDGRANRNADEPMRSVESIRPAYVRFVNESSRSVDVIWINYEGQRVKYKTLLPKQGFDANTYVSHPWVFTDSATQERLIVKVGKPVERVPHFLPEQRRQRELICITGIPLFSLKERCLQVVRLSLDTVEDAYSLNIPATLKKELLKL